MPEPQLRMHENRRAVAIAAAPTTPITRFVDAIWLALHAIGAHRWRDGYDVDADRGMRQYRGSRCTICDSPWEGW
jgi:hypothetical protein